MPFIQVIFSDLLLTAATLTLLTLDGTVENKVTTVYCYQLLVLNTSNILQLALCSEAVKSLSIKHRSIDN